MNIRDAYGRWAATYDADRNLTRDLDQAVTARALAGRRCARALEAGCGTGKNTALLAGLAQRVLALDFSAPMVGQARARPGLGNVRFVLADLAGAWPCAAGCAELVTCNLVLEHLADLPHVFAEAARALTPGGELFVSELHPFRQYLGKKATFARDGQAIEIASFVHHVSDFLAAAAAAGLLLRELHEWWHDDDVEAPPRLVSFLFAKQPASASPPASGHDRALGSPLLP